MSGFNWPIKEIGTRFKPMGAFMSFQRTYHARYFAKPSFVPVFHVILALGVTRPFSSLFDRTHKTQTNTQTQL